MVTCPGPRPVAADSPIGIGQSLMELHHQMHRVLEQAMAGEGLTVARAKVLIRLHDAGPMNQARLAELLGFAPRSVTESVDVLAREGLLTRAEDPKDRRARILELTPAGHDAYETAVCVRQKTMTQIFGSLAPAQRSELAALITDIRTSLNSGLGSGEDNS